MATPEAAVRIQQRTSLPLGEALWRSACYTYAFWIRSPRAVVVPAFFAALPADSLLGRVLTALSAWLAVLVFLTGVLAVIWSRPRQGRVLWTADARHGCAGVETKVETHGQGSWLKVGALYAAPRRRGLGRALTTTVLEEADRRGDHLALHVLPGRLRTRYEHAGFRKGPTQRWPGRVLMPLLARSPQSDLTTAWHCRAP